MKPCLIQTHSYLFPTWYRGRMYTLYGGQSSTSYGIVPGRYGGNRGTLYGDSRQTDYMNGYVAANPKEVDLSQAFAPISGVHLMNEGSWLSTDDLYLLASDIQMFHGISPNQSGYISNANGDASMLASGSINGAGVVVSVDHGPAMQPQVINLQEEAEMFFGAPALPGAAVSGSFNVEMSPAASSGLIEQLLQWQGEQYGMPVSNVSVQTSPDGQLLDVSFVAQPVYPVQHISVEPALAYDLSQQSLQSFLDDIDVNNLDDEMYEILVGMLNQAANYKAEPVSVPQ